MSYERDVIPIVLTSDKNHTVCEEHRQNVAAYKARYDGDAEYAIPLPDL